MRAVRLLPAAILALALGAGLNAAEIKARALKVTGNVVYKTGESGAWQSLQAKMELGKNCFIETREKASVSLEVPDKGVIMIHELSSISLVSIDRSGQNFSVRIKMFFGRLWNRIKKNEKDEKSSVCVDAPAAIAAVRGTTFYVESNADTNTAKIGVWEGAVNVTGRAGPETKTVEANYEIIVLYNKPLQDPVKMKLEEIRRERELQENILNLGVASMFPAARGMVEINDMQTNQATDALNKAKAQIKGEKIIRDDFEKLKKAIARLYADTGYLPGKEITGNQVRKGALNSLNCLVKDEDRRGARIPKWKGPYLDSDLKDPFGGQYGVYLGKTRAGGEYLILYSLGFDKLPSKDDTEMIYKMQELQKNAKPEQESAGK